MTWGCSGGIIVLGGGPAGMMAAIRAGELQQDVTLIEKNPDLGRKLLLSGKGRCNLTNAGSLDTFLVRFSSNGDFLRDAFKRFFNQDLISFFAERGLKLKIERQLRVFPQSNSSRSILGILKKELEKKRVRIIYKAEVKDIIAKDNKLKGVALSDARFIAGEKIILATGGVSYSFTGSCGDGFRMARALGHSIVRLRPGLVPLETKPRYPLAGLTLRNIRIRFSDGKKEIVSGMGELLFTGCGISGPLVLTLSGQVTDWSEKNKHLSVKLDLKPALSEKQLDLRLLREFKLNPKRSLKKTLNELLPQRLAGVFIQLAKISPGRKVSQVTQEERSRLISLFKGWRLDVLRPRPIEEAMITQGGVSLKEINPRTMESRLVKGLYFAGELLDVDADTGGFNLQAAFSTGYLAGESAAKDA